MCPMDFAAITDVVVFFFAYFFVCSLGPGVSHIFRLEFHLSEREDINLRSVGSIFCIVSSQVF